MTADDAIQERAAAMYEHDRVAALLGITIDVTDGAAEATMIVRPDMTNGFAMAHGGIIFTLADTAFAYACNSRGGRAVAFQCSITFVEPGAIGETLVARAREVLRNGRTGLYDVEVTAGSRIIAAFRGHSRHSEKVSSEIKAV